MKAVRSCPCILFAAVISIGVAHGHFGTGAAAQADTVIGELGNQAIFNMERTPGTVIPLQ